MAKTADKSKLQLLLGANLAAHKEITPSQRIKELGIAITVKPLDEKDITQARSSATKPNGELDEFILATKTLELSLVDPSPAEIMEATGSATQELGIKQLFNVGERMTMAQEIMKLSGFAPIQEEVDELKN